MGLLSYICSDPKGQPRVPAAHPCAGSTSSTLLLLPLLPVFCSHLEDRCGFCVPEGRCSLGTRCSGSLSRANANGLIALSPCFSVRNPGFVSAEWPPFLLCCRSDDHEEASVLPLLHAGFNRVCTRGPNTSLEGRQCLPGSPLRAKHTAMRAVMGNRPQNCEPWKGSSCMRMEYQWASD